MEQAIRAELWKVLDTSDLDSITSKEVGRVRGQGGSGARMGWQNPPAGSQRSPPLGAFPPSSPPILSQSRMRGLSSSE